MRFNRQAQLVHVGGLEGVVTVPWRSVKPFFNHGIQGALKLYFPEPSVAINKHNQSVKCYERTLSKDPYGIDGTMDWRDIGLKDTLHKYPGGPGLTRSDKVKWRKPFATAGIRLR